MKKKLLFSVTAKDCRWDYYRGTGKGGQKRNKTENCCRCTHLASGAVGKAEDGKSKEHNKKTAFKRMVSTKKFKDWLRLESSRATGELAAIQEKVDAMMHESNLKIEGKDEEGRWISLKEDS